MVVLVLAVCRVPEVEADQDEDSNESDHRLKNSSISSPLNLLLIWSDHLYLEAFFSHPVTALTTVAMMAAAAAPPTEM